MGTYLALASQLFFLLNSYRIEQKLITIWLVVGLTILFINIRWYSQS